MCKGERRLKKGCVWGWVIYNKGRGWRGAGGAARRAYIGPHVSAGCSRVLAAARLRARQQGRGVLCEGERCRRMCVRVVWCGGPYWGRQQSISRRGGVPGI